MKYNIFNDEIEVYFYNPYLPDFVKYSFKEKTREEVEPRQYHIYTNAPRDKIEKLIEQWNAVDANHWFYYDLQEVPMDDENDH